MGKNLERQRSVMELVTRGSSIAETAETLGLKPKAVQRLRTRAFNSLGIFKPRYVVGATDAALAALALGEISTGEVLAGFDREKLSELSRAERILFEIMGAEERTDTSSRQLAQDLHLSVGRVKNLISEVTHKLGITRTELALISRALTMEEKVAVSGVLQ